MSEGGKADNSFNTADACLSIVVAAINAMH